MSEVWQNCPFLVLPSTVPNLETDLQAFPYLPLGLGLYMFIFKG